jgi:hypothetical protein
MLLSLWQVKLQGFHLQCQRWVLQELMMERPKLLGQLLLEWHLQHLQE